MNIFLKYILVILIAQNLLSQVCIKSNSKKAFIKEDDYDPTDWYLSPESKPDVYLSSKCVGVKKIKLVTDCDSVSVNLKPNSTYSFVVILNGKDSCYTKFETPPLKNYSNLLPEIHDTIPFVLTQYNNIKIKCILNEKDTILLYFDCGANGFYLINQTIKKKLALNTLDNHNIKFGKQTWNKINFKNMELAAQLTDGRFGWDVLDGYVVEIDYDKSWLIIHSKKPKIKSSYMPLELVYKDNYIFVKGELVFNNLRYKNLFMVKDGYQSTIMFDKELMREQNFPSEKLEILKKSFLLNSKADTIPVVFVKNEKFFLNKFLLKNVPVQLLFVENPIGIKTHVIGSEILKRFNFIFDFQNNVVYIKPNSLYNLPYKI